MARRSFAAKTRIGRRSLPSHRALAELQIQSLGCKDSYLSADLLRIRRTKDCRTCDEYSPALHGTDFIARSDAKTSLLHCHSQSLGDDPEGNRADKHRSSPSRGRDLAAR